jgi:hypothetical protein
METPLKYYPPKGGKVQRWSSEDFFRVVSLPSYVEEYNGLGNCAVGRCVQLAQLMIALYRHDEEQLGARAPRGLLLLSGIKQKQWVDAMEARDAQLDGDMSKYFGAIAVLASGTATVDGKLLALSELPKGFDQKIWMDMIMYGFSLCFGYDPSEFWPVQYGSLGRGNETQIQHEKATGKGRLDFVLGFQEQLQNYLPESISFLFEQRDDQGDLLHLAVEQAKANVVKTLYTSEQGGVPLITNPEGRVMLAEYGVIPSSWSPSADIINSDQGEADEDPSPEEVDSTSASTNGQSTPTSSEPTATNPDAASATAQRSRALDLLREEVKEQPFVWEAARRFPNDPIVKYVYPQDRVITIWERGEDVLAKRIF